MASFKKKNYTEPVVCNHNNDLSKDWYVFFRFKHDGKVRCFKRREGINRIKTLSGRLIAIGELLEEVEFDLRNGWNPVTDPKRENEYMKTEKKEIHNEIRKKVKGPVKRKLTNKELFLYYFNM